MENYFTTDQELEVLQSFMPAALREGALLVELKSNDQLGFTSASVVTLKDNEVIGSKPEINESDYGTWCFNINRNHWIWLDYKSIKAVQPWPIQDFETIKDLQYQTQLLT